MGYLTFDKKKKICFNCGKEIDSLLRRTFCSDKCQKEGRKIKDSERAKEIRELNIELNRCTCCGKERDSLRLTCSKCRKKDRLKRNI